MNFEFEDEALDKGSNWVNVFLLVVALALLVLVVRG